MLAHAIPPWLCASVLAMEIMKKRLFLLSAAAAVSSAFAATPTPPVAPAGSPTPAKAAAPSPMPAPATSAPIVAPTQAAAPKSLNPVVGGPSATAPVPTPAAAPVSATPTDTCAKPVVKKKKKRKPKAAPVTEAATEQVSPEQAAYEKAVRDRKALLESRAAAKLAATWTNVESTGCAFMGPLFEKILSSAEGEILVPMPPTWGTAPKITASSSWIRAELTEGSLVVRRDANPGQLRAAHLAIEAPSAYCDVIVHQHAAR